MQSLLTVSFVLVGLCNANPLIQTYLGQLVFRESTDNTTEPQLFNVCPGDTGYRPYRPRFAWKRKGLYRLEFPDLLDGVAISLDRACDEYRFTTGINPKSSGSSGPLAYGGPELTDALDQLFGFITS